MTAPARTGWLPFKVAIIAAIVGLLVATCAFLLLYGLHANARNMEILGEAYLDQVAENTAREVARLPRLAGHILPVQAYAIETGALTAAAPTVLGRAFAAALHADRKIKWVSYGEDATGRFVGATRV